MLSTRSPIGAILLIATFALIAAASAQARRAPAQPPAAPPGPGGGRLLRHQRRPGRWCQPGRPGGGRQALSDAGAGRWSGQSHVARVSQPDREQGATLPVNARDRIGSGPWYNAKGVIIAANVDELHGDSQRDRNNIRKPIALNEKGEVVSGAGDTPNIHDILTGSDSHGRAMLGRPDVTTCGNWTSNAAGNAMVGHHDRLGGPNSWWNAVHLSNGCSQQNLVSTGGAGFLLYCFAAN